MDLADDFLKGAEFGEQPTGVAAAPAGGKRFHQIPVFPREDADAVMGLAIHRTGSGERAQGIERALDLAVDRATQPRDQTWQVRFL